MHAQPPAAERPAGGARQGEPDPGRYLGLILARGGSKGVPRKNLRVVGGAPLIARAVTTLRAVPEVARIVVSTDDGEIAAAAIAAGADVPFLRPARLAADDTPALDAVAHAVRWLRGHGERAGAVVLLQATSPGCRADQVSEAIALFRRAGGASLRSVTEATEHPQWMGRIEGDRLTYLFPREERAARRQDVRCFHRLNGAICIWNVDRILAGQPDEEHPLAYVMDASSSVDIDTLEDLERAEVALE